MGEVGIGLGWNCVPPPYFVIHMKLREGEALFIVLVWEATTWDGE